MVLPIAANQNESDEMINEVRCQRGIPLVLRDAGCRVADEWQAQTTPHAFVIDPSGILRYRGPVDDVTFRKRTPERFYVEEAVDALLKGRIARAARNPALWMYDRQNALGGWFSKFNAKSFFFV